MDMKNLVDKAKDLVEERKDGLPEDLKELKDIAQGEGSLMDKAKDAVEALKDPGAPGEDAPKQ
jgi:hypothetical protein